MYLRDCDLIIGCVDREWPRLILCEAAYQYLLPYIDTGSEIGLDSEIVQSMDARVSYVAPGRPCLLCSGVISTKGIALESHGADELQRMLDMGYSRDFRLKAPAVMELNMRATSMAGLLLRHLVQPFLATPLAHSYRESVTTFTVKKVNYETQSDCPVCGNRLRVGTGNAFRLSTRPSAPTHLEPSTEFDQRNSAAFDQPLVASGRGTFDGKEER